MAEAIQFTISPKDALIDTPQTIIINNLPPNQAITVTLETEDEASVKWESKASFISNDQGTINVSTFPSQDGNYTGVDGMGLFWSMTPKDIMKPCLFVSPSLKPIVYKLSCYEKSNLLKSISFSRFKLQDNILREPVTDPRIIGTLFHSPSQNPLPLIIVLGGSNGGLHEEKSALLASKGFASLALAYFGHENLPKNLEEIPLEYFEHALEWTKQHPLIDSKRIGILGTSRGGELTLLLGSLFQNEFKAIAANVPSCAVYSSFSMHNPKNVWLYRGSPLLPFAPFSSKLPDTDGQSPETAIALSPSFLGGMEENPEAFQQAMIHVENISCPLLIISAENDLMWPSFEFCELLTHRLSEMASPIRVKHITNPKAGHIITVPYYPTTNAICYHKHALFWFDMGGEPKAQALACQRFWEETIQFFKENI